MDYDFTAELNELLVDTYNTINKVEENALRQIGVGKLSISEFHILESVGTDNTGKTIGEIASSLSVTLPTITVAINKLESKGYVCRNKSQDDGRRVYITLTKLGRRMNAAHRYFHENMVCELCRGYSESELKMLIDCLYKLNSYFKKNDFSKNIQENDENDK